MRRLKVLGLALLAAFALASLAAASASAAPTLTTLGEEIIAEGVAEGTDVGELSTALSSPIKANAVKLLLAWPSAGGSSGTYDAHFTGANFEGVECNTPGDKDGVILVKGPANLVWLSLSPLISGAEFVLTEPLIIECGPLGKPKLKIKVEGQALGKIEAATGKEVQSFTGELKCTAPNNGKQAFKEFEVKEGEKVKASLKANLGLGNESACEEVKESVTVTTEEMGEFHNL